MRLCSAGWFGCAQARTPMLDALAEDSLRGSSVCGTGLPIRACSAALRSLGYRRAFYSADAISCRAEANAAAETLDRLSRSRDPFALFFGVRLPTGPEGLSQVPAEDAALYDGRELRMPPGYTGSGRYRVGSVRPPTAAETAVIQPRLRGYYAGISAADAAFGILLSAAEELELMRDTLTVFTSPRGICFGEHGCVGSGNLYNETVLVPFLLRQDLAIRPGSEERILSTAELTEKLPFLLRQPLSNEALPFRKELTLRGSFGLEAVRGERYTSLRTPKGTRVYDHTFDPYQLNPLPVHAGDASHLPKGRVSE